MKPRPALLLAMSLTVVAGFAVESGATKNVRIDLDAQAQPAPSPSPTTKSTPPKSAPVKSTTKSPEAKTTTSTPLTTPGKAAPPAKEGAAKKKKDEPPAKIEGMEISRGDRGFLGVKIEGNTWKISFYDQRKKPKPADVAHVALRWPVVYQPNPERALLSPADGGKVMTSDKAVRPPFTFKLYVTLLGDDASADAAGESYVVDFQQ